MEEMFLTGFETVGIGAILLYIIYRMLNDNEDREDRYIKVIKQTTDVVQEQQLFISKQSKTMEEISITVKDTSEAIRDLSRDVADVKTKIERGEQS